MIVVADTSGLVAAFNSADPEHLAARKPLIQAALTVVSPLVLLEIDHVTTRNVGRPVVLAINDWLLAQERTGRVAIAPAPAPTLRTVAIFGLSPPERRCGIPIAARRQLTRCLRTPSVVVPGPRTRTIS